MSAADIFEPFLTKQRQKMFRDLVCGILPSLDNLQHALLHVPISAEGLAVAKGVELFLAQFDTELAALGITRIETVGLEFDPRVHEVIQEVETAAYPPGVVAKEISPGYRHSGGLLRAARVTRAKAHPSAKDLSSGLLGVRDVAKILGMCENSVRKISAKELPFVVVGAGDKRKRRKYYPADVQRYLAARASV